MEINKQAETAVRLLEEAVNKLCSQLPTEIDAETAAKIETIVARIEENREKRKTQTIPEGKYFVNPFSKSTYLKDLRDLLLIFKRVVIPMKIREEVAKLQSLSAMAKQIGQVDQVKLHEEMNKANLAASGPMETIGQMAQIIGNLAKNG
jgi:hypothetical protein